MAVSALDQFRQGLKSYSAMPESPSPVEQVKPEEVPPPKTIVPLGASEGQAESFDDYLKRVNEESRVAKELPKMSKEDVLKVEAKARAAYDKVGFQWLPEWIRGSKSAMSVAAGQAADKSVLLWADRAELLKDGKDLPKDQLDYLQTLEDLAAWQGVIDKTEEGTAAKLLYSGLAATGQIVEANLLTPRFALNPFLAGTTAGTGAMLRAAPGAAAVPGVGAAASIAAGSTAAMYAGGAAGALHSQRANKGEVFRSLVGLKDVRTGKPVPLESALFGAEVVGTLDAFIELVNLPLVAKLVPGLNPASLTGKAFTRGLMKTPKFVEFLTKWGGRWAAGTGSEILEEIAQDLARITAETFYQNRSFKKAYKDPAIRAELQDTVKQVAMGMGTLFAAGSVINARGEWQQISSERDMRQREANIRAALAAQQNKEDKLADDLQVMGPDRQMQLPWTELEALSESVQPEIAPLQEKVIPKGVQQDLPFSGIPDVVEQPAPVAEPAAPPPAAPVQQQLPMETQPQAPAEKATLPPVPAAKAQMPVDQITTQFTSTDPETGETTTVDSGGKSYYLKDPELIKKIRPKELRYFAARKRDGTLIVSDVAHDPLPSAKSTKSQEEAEKVAETIQQAKQNVYDKMRQEGITPQNASKVLAFDEDPANETTVPQFGWVIKDPSIPQDKQLFVSLQEYEGATGYFDSMYQYQFRNLTTRFDAEGKPVQPRTEAQKKAAEARQKKADVYKAVDHAVVEDVASKSTKNIQHLSRKTVAALGRIRPSFRKDEAEGSVQKAVAKILADTELETKGQPLDERVKAFKRNLYSKIRGLSINYLEETKGKRREIEQRMKDKTLNETELDAIGQEGGSALVNQVTADRTLAVPAPKTSMVPNLEEAEKPGKVKSIPPPAGVTKVLSPKDKVKYQNYRNELVNQYFNYKLSKPERTTMTPEQIIAVFKAAKNPKYKWGARAESDFLNEVKRRGIDLNATTRPEAPSKAQGKEQPKKPIQAKAKKKIVEPEAPPAVTSPPTEAEKARNRAEVKAIAVQEIKNRETERRNRDYVPKTKRETDSLRETPNKAKATDTIIGEAKRDEKLFENPGGKFSFIKFASAQKKAQEVGGTVLPTRRGTYVVSTEPFGRVAFDIETLTSGLTAAEKANRKETPTPTTATATQADVLAAIEATEKPTKTSITSGDRVKIKPGLVGSNYTFVVESISNNQVYGKDNYGPVRLQDVTLVAKQPYAHLNKPKQANTKVRAAAKEVKNTVQSLADKAKQINDIFGEKGEVTLKGGELDPGKYAKIKPILDGMWEDSKKLGWDVTKFVQEVLKMLGEQARPYFKQWASTDLKTLMEPPKAEPVAPVVNPKAADKLGRFAHLFGIAPPAETVAAPPKTVAQKRAEAMTKPRLTGKKAAFEEDIQSSFQEAVAVSGIKGPALQEKLVKYGTDTNKLVTKADGQVIWTGLQGIKFQQAKNPDVADGLIFPVGDNQYIIFKPEQAGVTPDLLEITTAAVEHRPVTLAAPSPAVTTMPSKVGGKVPVGPTMSEYRASLSPEAQEKFDKDMTTPFREVKPPPLKDDSLLKEHLARTSNLVPPAKTKELEHFLAKNGITLVKVGTRETAWRLKEVDTDVIKVAEDQYLLVPKTAVNAFAAGKDLPPAVKTLAQEEIDTTNAEFDKRQKLSTKLPKSATEVSDPLMRRGQLTQFSVGDSITTQTPTMFEATMFDSMGQIVEHLTTTVNDKSKFLNDVRSKGQELNASQVVITQSLDMKPSTEHTVYRITEVPVSPQKLSSFIANQTGSSNFITDMADFLIHAPKNVKNQMARMWSAVANAFDVESRWVRQGLPEIGFAVKNYFSRIDSSQRRAMQDANVWMKQFKKDFNYEGDWVDLLNIVLAQENSGRMWDRATNKLVPANFDSDWMAKAAPSIKALSDYFESARIEFDKRGVRLDFVGNQYQRTMAKLELAKANQEFDKVAKYQSVLNHMEGLNFTHIPYRMIFDKKLKEYIATNNEQVRRKKMAELRTIMNRARKSPTIAALLEPDKNGELRINPKDINPVMIIMNYGNNKGLEHAMLDVRDAVFSYGNKVAIISKKKPIGLHGKDWQVLPANMKIFETAIPEANRETHKIYVTTELIRALQDAMGFASPVGKFKKMLAWIKMSAFYNPFMLPFYNLFQLVMGGFKPWKFKYRKAGRDVGGFAGMLGKQYGVRTENYFRAMDQGLASQPFPTLFDDMEAIAKSIATAPKNSAANFVAAVAANFGARTKRNWEDMGLLKPLAPAKAILEMVTNMLQHLAWFGDEYTRMLVFNYLKDMNHTDRNAAQIAALVLGDYASVPAKTRKTLNMIFFTPTYKASMTKFIAKMAAALFSPGAWKTMVGGTPGQKLTHKVERRYLYSALTTLGMNWIIGRMAAAMGLEEDEYLRRWTRRIETEAGEREMAYVLASPANIAPKYVNKALHVLRGDPGSLDTMPVRAFRFLLSELHPFWNGLVQLINNKSQGGDTIVKHAMGPVESAKQYLKFALKLYAPVVTYAYGQISGKGDVFEGQSIKQAREALRAESGLFWDVVTDIFVFKYLRNTPEQRMAASLKKITQTIPKEIKDEQIRTGDIPEDWIERYIDRYQLVLEREGK